MLSISTGLPNCREGRLHPVGVVDPSWLVDVAQEAEGLGFDSLWLNEFLTSDPSVLRAFDDPPLYYDPLAVIAFLAPQTTTIRFFPSTIVLPLHEPLLLARQVSTIDHLSGGRLTLGIGLGGSAGEFAQLHGELVKPNRGAMMNEYLTVLRDLWEQDTTSYQGHYVSIDSVQMYPKPLQSPMPIYLAGSAAAVEERIASFGHGWIDTIESPEVIREKASRLRGRDGLPAAIARQFYVAIAPTADQAQRIVSEALPMDRKAGSDATASGVTHMSVVGSPDHVFDVISQYVAAGASDVAPIFYGAGAPVVLEQMRLFATEVAPRLRDIAPAATRSQARD